jgi:hypothetical protein
VSATWGARCRKPARRVLRGGMGTRSHAGSVRALSRKGQLRRGSAKATAPRPVPTSHALDAQSGKVLFRLNLADTIQGGVITYSAHREQYVAVVSGDGGVISKRNMPEISGGDPAITVLTLPKK